MRLYIFFFALFISFECVYSQVSINPEPFWIVHEDYDPKAETPENGVDGGTHILLYTEQVNVEREEVYTKSATKVIEFSGIQNNSLISADYDPSYQKLSFHKIEVVRNGKTINKLAYKDIQTARRETNAENFIYDGTISTFVNIPDVRMGDIVISSYSIKGFNPIQKDSFSTSFFLNSTRVIDRLAIHVFGKRKLKYQILNSELEVKHEKTKNLHHYEWSHSQVPAVIWEEQSPVWYFQSALVIVSEYESWAEVIKWGEEIFTFKEPLNQELKSIVAQIKRNHKTDGARIKEALAFVQNEVRYLAVHSGIGGYKPNPPNKVILQRYGDCKDKSVLLTAMLNAMDIEAYPTLVNTSLGKLLPTLTPSSKLFDHCIVKVVGANDNILWYDPTLTEQGGSFDKIYLPDYGYGLVLDKQITYLDTIANFRNNMVESFSTYKLEKEGKGASLEIRTDYYEGEADFMRGIFRNNNKEIIGKELLKFYAETYGSIAAIDPPVFVDDSLSNKVSIFELYQIDSIWRPSIENPNQRNFAIIPKNLTSVLTMPTQVERSSPFALNHPMVRKQNIEVFLTENMRIRPESSTINSDFFYYDFDSKYDSESKVLTLNYYYKNQDDHVPANRFNEFYKDMVQLDRQIGYSIFTYGNRNASNSAITWSLNEFAILGSIGLVLVVLLGVLIIVIQRRGKNA